MLAKTARMEKNSGLKATINYIGLSSPITWVGKAFKDFMLCPKIAIFYGGMFTLVVYNLWAF